jgi:anti-sigma B factor antagonist
MESRSSPSQGTVVFRVAEGLLIAKPDTNLIERGSDLDYRQHMDPILEKVEGGYRTVLLDLGEIDYMRSTGLGALLELFERLKEKGCRLAIASPPILIKNLFQCTAVTEILPVYSSVEEAIESERGRA